ncbi:MAG: hypothetical protein ACJ8ER_15385 [Allosphingosinicella sp.]
MSDDVILKSFDLADAATKQLLVLATGTIAGAIALLDKSDVAGINLGAHSGAIQFALWVLTFSVIFGVAAMFNLLGTLARPPAGGPTIYKASIRLFSGLQLLSYPIGLLLLVRAAFL